MRPLQRWCPRVKMRGHARHNEAPSTLHNPRPAPAPALLWMPPSRPHPLGAANQASSTSSCCFCPTRETYVCAPKLFPLFLPCIQMLRCCSALPLSKAPTRSFSRTGLGSLIALVPPITIQKLLSSQHTKIKMTR
uniref:Uncharacterized protein n=1 Tax=Arundo donax TaxID=35708 RepID=A0A0A8XXG8_ARUDO